MKSEGVESGEGLCLPQLGVWGLAPPPKKKINFALKNYAILSKFWYFFPILQQKVGDYPASPESGGTYPPVPLLRRLSPRPLLHKTTLTTDVTETLY